MDTKRWAALVLVVGGIAVAAVGMAASPVLPPMSIAVGGPIALGAALGGYRRHQGTPLARVWALVYGAGAGLTVFANFGTAALLRPTISANSDLGAVWSGLIVGGYLVSLVGAWLWERDARVRRFAARALLGVWLLTAGVFARESGDPWPLLAAPAMLLGFAMLLVAFGSRRPAHTEPVPGWPSTLHET